MKNTTTKLLAVCASLVGLCPFANAQNKPKTLHIVYEAFSLPLKKAAALQRERLEDGQLYGQMLAGVKEGSIKQEKLLMARTLPGQKTTAEHITEYIYNTEAEPPELPNQVGGTIDAQAAMKLVAEAKAASKDGVAPVVFPGTPGMPSAFDTKNVGDTLEVEANVGAVDQFVDLRFRPSHITFIQNDFWGRGLSKIKMPRFGRQGPRTGLTVVSGMPAYVGTASPPAELQPKNGDEITWLTFITVSVVTQ